jgi:hypothetical protein
LTGLPVRYTPVGQGRQPAGRLQKTGTDVKRQRLHRATALAHKWIGLILGLQVLAWTAGGFIMAWLPINEVRSEHRIAEQPAVALDPAADLLPLSALLAQAAPAVTSATYGTLLRGPVVYLHHADGTRSIRDAATGALLSPLDEATARTIAAADFKPDVPVSSTRLLDAPVTEYRGALPVWQIVFADAENTALYVSPSDARVLARRSDTWRLFDFVWMLHIMDYDTRDDINNPLLVAFAFTAALFSLSGLALLIFRFHRRDFNFILGRRRKRISP